MRIAIVGSGDLARVLAYRIRAIGHDIVLTDLPDGKALAEAAAATGVPTASIEDAARSSDIVVLAIPFWRYRELPAAAFKGKVVVDATDYYPDRDGPMSELGGTRVSTSEILAQHLDGAHVVKTLNASGLLALPAIGTLAHDVTPVAIPVAGDSPKAKGVVADLLVDLGFDPVDAGTLRDSWRMQPGMPAFGLVTDATGLRWVLDAA
jgi:predicted dinucleotide-binding enzyme